MAIVKGPLFSLGASGTVGGALTYTSVGGITVAGVPPTPGKSATAAQVASRNAFRSAAWWWKNAGMTALDKSLWKNMAKHAGKRGNGYQIWIQEYKAQCAAQKTIEVPLDFGCVWDVEHGVWYFNFFTPSAQEWSLLYGPLSAGYGHSEIMDPFDDERGKGQEVEISILPDDTWWHARVFMNVQGYFGSSGEWIWQASLPVE